MSELTGSNHRCCAQFKCLQTVVGQHFPGSGPNGLSYYYYYYYYYYCYQIFFNRNTINCSCALIIKQCNIKMNNYNFMFTCHKLASNAVLQVCRLSDVCATLSVYHASVVRGCVPMSVSSSLVYHFWFLKTPSPSSNASSLRRCVTVVIPMKTASMQSKQLIYIYIYIYPICIWYCFQLNYTEQQLLLTPTIFFYIIIYGKCIKSFTLGCFSPSRGKSVEKNSEVNRVKLLALVKYIQSQV